MTPLARHLTAFLLLFLGLPGPLAAQSGPGDGRGNDLFASENAIVDTAIPFAIGAREAQQSLRGSFGWPTFQEGLVEGVYFRFDPDGYARFSPNPRLDVDVFEVICKSRTMTCMARKDPLSFFLTDRGQLQLRLDMAGAGYRFFVSEGISEIQIPERVLQPLDTQMENLLATGGELIIRRGGEEIARASLRGFVATASYLRWIASGQDYAVLPRGWPVPNAARRPDTAGVTQAVNWASPMPQPQRVAPPARTLPPAMAVAPPPLLSPPVTSQVPPAAADPQAGRVEAELAQLRRMIADLAQLRAAPAPAVADAAPPGPAEAASDVETLRALARQLQGQLDQLRDTSGPMAAPVPTTAAVPVAPPIVTPAARPVMTQAAQLAAQQAAPVAATLPMTQPLATPVTRATPLATPLTAPLGSTLASTGPAPASGPAEAVPPGSDDPSAEAVATARKLEMLMQELGLDLKTAVAVLEISAAGTPSGQTGTAGLRVGDRAPAAPPPVAVVFPGSGAEGAAEAGLVEQILSELEAEIASAAPPDEPQAASPVSPPPARPLGPQDYQLLTRYFRSVVLPALAQPAAGH
ncbi:hypothetical protein [Shimia sp.]|uniref:hypothetical protein n=1 Tax=Shimia sp. TaxID=1954381 RepID=UPI003568C444